MTTGGLRRFPMDEDDDNSDNDTPILQSRPQPPPLYRPVLLPVPLASLLAPSASGSRESTGTRPGTSGMQSREGFQAPPLSRAANILHLSLGRSNSSVISENEASQASASLLNTQNTSETNYEDSDDEFLFEDVSQRHHSLTTSQGHVVEETSTTVTVDYNQEVK